MPRCFHCPAAGPECRGELHARLCELARTDARYRELIVDGVSYPRSDAVDEDPEPYRFMTGKDYPFRPRRIAQSGIIRVGLLSPVFLQGGAEAHMLSLARTVDRSRIGWAGCVAVSSQVDPDMREAMAAIMPFGTGAENAKSLASACDVLVTWGIDNLPAILSGIARPPRVIGVIHAPPESLWGQTTYAKPEGINLWVAVSELALEALPEVSRSVPSAILWNSVDETRLIVNRCRAEMRKSWGVPLSSGVVGYLGRLSSEKRPEIMPQIARHIPDSWRVVMVGDGAERRPLESMAAQIDRLHVVGPDNRAGDVLNAFDYLVVPSEHESFCLTMAEGFWMGVPVVSTPVGLAKIVPGLTRPIAQDAGGPEIVAAILADAVDTARTRERIEHARSFARERLSAERFGREWTECIAGMIPVSPVHANAHVANRIDPAVRDAVLACPHRGSVLPVSQQPSCGCGELSECRDGKGTKPGSVTLRDCLSCKTEELSR